MTHPHKKEPTRIHAARWLAVLQAMRPTASAIKRRGELRLQGARLGRAAGSCPRRWRRASSKQSPGPQCHKANGEPRRSPKVWRGRVACEPISLTIYNPCIEFRCTFNMAPPSTILTAAHVRLGGSGSQAPQIAALIPSQETH